MGVQTTDMTYATHKSAAPDQEMIPSYTTNL